MEEGMPGFVSYIISFIAVLGTAVILWGVSITFLGFLRLEFSRLRGEEVYRQMSLLRYHLVHHLLLGLEFLIAADIITSIIRPDLRDVAVLGAIVVIRTVLSYFLNKELRVREKSRKPDAEIRGEDE